MEDSNTWHICSFVTCLLNTSPIIGPSSDKSPWLIKCLEFGICSTKKFFYYQNWINIWAVKSGLRNYRRSVIEHCIQNMYKVTILLLKDFREKTNVARNSKVSSSDKPLQKFWVNLFRTVIEHIAAIIDEQFLKHLLCRRFWKSLLGPTTYELRLN